MNTPEGAETKATQSGASSLATPKPALSRPRAPRRFNRTTKQRFALDRWRQLVAHLGREPSYPEQIVIGRVIAIEWDLRRTDAKADAGEELSGHAMRARLAAENRLRLDLTALGLKPSAAQGPTLAAEMAAARRERLAKEGAAA